mgnify:CR=1 FL=1
MRLLVGLNRAAPSHVGLSDQEVEVEVLLPRWDRGLCGCVMRTEEVEAEDGGREGTQGRSEGEFHGLFR